jgi:uncharacterized DUF497 family protein
MGMMDTAISGFDRDEGNRAHCRKHGVSAPEVEDLFRRPVLIVPDPDMAHSHSEDRLRAIGRTRDGRPVFLVFTIRERDGERLIRPVSARDMHREEIESHEAENPDLQNR